MAEMPKMLDPSELGTKEYWDAAYEREIHNYEDDGDEEGTIWFSESNAEDKVIQLLESFQRRGVLSRDCRFLDLGTGNGHMLFALREETDDETMWAGEMVGVDYSESSVRLARQIALSKSAQVADTTGSYSPTNKIQATHERIDPTEIVEAREQRPEIRFELWDLLQQPPGDWLSEGFEVVLDKGTFDAISLMPPSDGSASPCHRYREKVIQLVKPGGFLCITSCNWTADELVEWLAGRGAELSLFAEGKYSKFTFGGRSGQSIVTVVFQRTESIRSQ